MDSLTGFFDSDFNTLQEQWEKSLTNELKIPDAHNKTTNKMLTGEYWPTLSLERKQEVQLPSMAWKRASTTYAHLSTGQIETLLSEDLKNGVRNFFFHKESLNDEKWKIIENVLAQHTDSRQIEVFLLDRSQFNSSRIKVVNDFFSGTWSHDRGGHAIQELAFMARDLVQKLEGKKDIYIGVYVDSLFFQNIAKLRAARLLATRILQESGHSAELKILALTSFEGWTLYERYSNLLRNETAVASAYIGGADHIQSSGYNILIERETDQVEGEHLERSLRMARNTSHVLSLESMLGVVQDSAFGSYHLENQTLYFCEEAWKLMQRLLSGESLENEISKVRDEKLLMMKTRKKIMSGINDYPDSKEELRLTLKEPSFFRRARIFEELRLRMEKVKKPEVSIALFGDYSALNGRLNFVKNYFELLGLVVHEPGHSEKDPEKFRKNISERNEDIIVLCAQDEDYPAVKEILPTLKGRHLFIAGKVEMENFTNLYMGQNVYDVLENLVLSFEGRK